MSVPRAGAPAGERRREERGRPTARLEATRVLLVAGAARGRVELLQFFRSKDAVVFTLALPVVLLVLLASIFSGDVPGTTVTYSQVYTTGLLAGGVASTSFLNLGIAVANERENGTLKRLAGTPMPRAAYFAGKVVVVVATTAVEVTVVTLVGHLAYGVALPATAGRWWVFVWVTLLGTTAMALVGIAASNVPRTASSAAAVLNLPFLVLEFISGVFVPFTVLSHELYAIAGGFPLRWIAEGYRAALLPATFQQVEPGHHWHYGEIALVLVAWSAGALVVSLLTFRWSSRSTR